MSDPDVAAITAQIAHLEDLLRGTRIRTARGSKASTPASAISRI
jgi:hypothetical protein